MRRKGSEYPTAQAVGEERGRGRKERMRRKGSERPTAQAVLVGLSLERGCVGSDFGFPARASAHTKFPKEPLFPGRNIVSTLFNLFSIPEPIFFIS